MKPEGILTKRPTNQQVHGAEFFLQKLINKFPASVERPCSMELVNIPSGFMKD